MIKNLVIISLYLIPYLGFSQLTISPGTVVRTNALISTDGNVINGSESVLFEQGSELLLNGSADQGINAVQNLFLPTLSIEGGGNKAIFGSVVISNQLNLTEGFLVVPGEIDDNNLILLNGASATTDGTSWVSGPLLQQGSGSKSYPLGAAGRYAPIELDISGNDETITGAFAIRNSNVFTLRDLPASIDSASNAWLWAVFSNNLTSLGVTLPILAEDEGIFSGRDELLPVVLEADTVENLSANLGGSTTSFATGLNGVSSQDRSTNSSSGGEFAKIFLLGAELTTVPIIHNIITPNNDGSNDYLIIDAIGVYGDSNEVILLDRWGTEIYRKKNFRNFNDIDNPYDGSFDDLSPGNYICILKYAGQTAKQVITVLN
ncbi:MAG: gliding motility-associated C-terminal domain-containing protein [Fulvivirga sp.]|uniref:T9SS type B sorting domain-containing protein n=1 Tax=Fulvivirga sp. TaxID=1931237 RepID=UPI0032EE747F